MIKDTNNFLIIDGRVYCSQPSKDFPCRECDFRHDFGEQDCSCICDILRVPLDHCLKEVFSDIHLFTHL